MKPDDKGVQQPYHGTGIIVGVIIAANRRIQVLVKDDNVDLNAAISLDDICINPTGAEADAYFAHNTKLRGVVEEHNVAQQQRETEKIQEVDSLNAEMFGPSLTV